MDIERILKEGEENYNKSKVPSFIRDAIEKTEARDNAFTTAFKRFNKIVGGLYKVEKSFYNYLESTLYNPDVIDYITESLLKGRKEKEIISNDFVATRPTYSKIPSKKEFGSTLLEIFPNIKFVTKNDSIKLGESLIDIYQGELVGTVPGDRSMGDVTFNAYYTTLDTRKDRIEKLKQLANKINSNPRPNVLYIPMSEKKARQVLDSEVITGEIIANDYPVTYDMDKNIIGVAWNHDGWKPLALHMVETDSYPEQLFSDEFEEWMTQLRTMWYTDEYPVEYIHYFIDLWHDSFWHEGFLRKWNRAGGGGAAIDSIKTEFSSVVQPTEQDEFFTDIESPLSYRLDPGAYDTPITGNIENKFTINQLSAGNLYTEYDYNTNTGCLKYNKLYGGVQTYYRVFRSQEGRPKSNAYIFLSGCDEEVTLAHLRDDDFRMDIKLPGVTGWLDCTKNFEERGFTGADGQGIFLSLDRFGKGILELTFAQFSNEFSGRQAILRIIHVNKPGIALNRVSFINWRNLYS